jgi:hypothetical protein
MILGLDISTSITGYTILDLNGNLVEMNHVNMTKIKDGFWAKIDRMQEFVDELKGRGITKVFIEEPLSKFTRGQSSAATISLLLRFNGICSYLVHKRLGLEPIYLNPTTARSLCKVKLVSKKKAGGLTHKEQTFQQITSREPFVDKEWPLKRTGRLKDYCYDEIDSYVIAFGGFSYKEPAPKLKKKKKAAKTAKKKKSSN